MGRPLPGGLPNYRHMVAPQMSLQLGSCIWGCVCAEFQVLTNLKSFGFHKIVWFVRFSTPTGSQMVCIPACLGPLGPLGAFVARPPTCRAQNIPRMTRGLVATSRRLGMKRAADDVRLAHPTRHVFEKKTSSSCWKPTVVFAVMACRGKELLDITSCT